MKQSTLNRLKKLAEKIDSGPIEIWHLITMPNGSEIKTQDDEEAERLEAQGGTWDLVIVAHDKRSSSFLN